VSLCNNLSFPIPLAADEDRFISERSSRGESAFALFRGNPQRFSVKWLVVF